jgi:hypothetical protein
MGEMKLRIALVESAVLMALMIAVSASASSSQREYRTFIAGSGQMFGVAGTNILCNVGSLRSPLLIVECTLARNGLVRRGAYGFGLSDIAVDVDRVSASHAPVNVFTHQRRPPYVVGDLAQPASQSRDFFRLAPGDLVRLSRMDIACAAFRTPAREPAILCYIAASAGGSAVRRTFTAGLTQRAVIVQSVDAKGHSHLIYSHRQPS